MEQSSLKCDADKAYSTEVALGQTHCFKQTIVLYMRTTTTTQDRHYALKVCVHPSSFVLWRMYYCYNPNLSQTTSPGFESCYAEKWRRALVAAGGCIPSRGDAGADDSTLAQTHTGLPRDCDLAGVGREVAGCKVVCASR